MAQSGILRTFTTTACDQPEIDQGAAVSVAMSVNGRPNAFALQLNASGDTGDTFSWTISQQPPTGGGNASVAGGTTTNGQPRTINYTPPDDTAGSFAFTVRATGNSGFAETVVTVNIGLESPVIAQGPSIVVSTAPASLLNIPLSATDADSAQLAWSVVSAPEHGTVDVPAGTTASGGVKTVSYTPAADIAAQTLDTFTIEVADESDHIDTISIAVNIVPDGVLAGYIEFDAQQGAASGFYVLQLNGPVTVTGALSIPPLDPDALSFDWSGSSSALFDMANINDGIFSFDPVALQPGHYVLDLVVSQGTASTHNQVVLTVLENAAVPAADNLFDCNGDGVVVLPEDDSDCDNDGAGNLADGVIDTDADGIPDYLDGNPDAGSLQNQTGDPDAAELLLTEPGLKIRLGSIARIAGRYGALIAMQDIADHGGSGGQPAANGIDSMANIGGIHDFEITGLSVAGASAQVVIPLLGAIQEGAEYRKYSSVDGWRAWNGAADIASARKVSGMCPPPGDAAYQPGLNAFDNCVQLTLVDGGPNDGDGEANGVIRDPGGVAVVDPSPGPQVEEPDDGGAGALQPLWLLLLLAWGIVLFKERTRKN